MSGLHPMNDHRKPSAALPPGAGDDTGDDPGRRR